MFEVIFATLDGLLTFLPAWARISVWGLGFGTFTMLVYGWLSPQDRIGAIKEEVEEARREMQEYTGTEFGPVWKMAKRSLSLSFKQLKVMLVPTLIAGVPIIAVLIWMEESYSYRSPEPGTTVEATVRPGESLAGDNPAVEWSPSSAATPTDEPGTREIAWPGGDSTGKTVELVDRSGEQTLVELPLEHPRLRVPKRSIWHWFFANPAGYLPDSAPVDVVQFDLPHRTMTPWGPTWLRTWHALFLVMLTISALGAKVAFDID